MHAAAQHQLIWMHSWMAGLLFANMPLKSAFGICNRETFFFFFRPSRFIYSFFWNTNDSSASISAVFLKKQRKKCERKMYFVNRLKLWAPIRLSNQKKSTGGYHPKYMPVSYTNMAAIHVGWQHKYVVAKVCFRLSRTCFDPGKKTPLPKQ